MKYWALLWSALWRKPARTVLALLSVVAAFTLFGLLYGVASVWDGITNGFAANRMQVQSISGFNGSLPISYASQIGQIDGVAAVIATDFLPGYYQDPKNTLFALAISGNRLMFDAIDNDISPAEAAAFARTKTGAVVARALADRFGWKLGDRIPFRSSVVKQDRSMVWEFELVGIYDTQHPFLGNTLWFHYDYLDEGRAFGKGTARFFSVLTRDAKFNASVADAIDARFANSDAPTASASEREWAQAALEQAIDFNLLVQAILGSSMFTLLLVTGNTMMESVRQRIPELAVLKAIGYPNSTILALVVVESGLLFLVGAGAGLLLPLALFPYLGWDANGETIVLPLRVVLQGAALALGVALVSAAAPAMLAHRLSVIEALRPH